MYHAMQRLLRTPVFTSVVAGLIGITVAALLTLGTAASALLWEPLPYPQGDRLLVVQGFASKMRSSIGLAPGLLEPLAVMPEVEAVASYDYSQDLYDGEGRAYSNVRIQPELIAMLGGAPQLGRLIGADDGADAVLLSATAWRNRFGADPDIVGRSVDFDGTRLRVIGVMAEGFHFPRRDTALWRPLRLTPEQLHGPDAFNFGAVQTLVRLAPQASRAGFDAALQAGLAKRPELEPMRKFLGLEMTTSTLRELWDAGRSSQIGLLVAAAGAVLILLLANVGSLWLSRWLQRARELAVRSALGASPRRMAMGLITEIALLTAAAVLFGLLIVPAGLSALEALDVLDANTPLLATPGVPTLLAAAVLIGALVLLLSLVPVWIARHPLALGLLAQGARAAGQGRSARNVRRGLVALQVGLAVSLLCGAGLLTRSLWQVLDQDVGFDPTGVSLVRVESREREAEAEDASRARLAALRGAFQAIPGVRYASIADAPPFSFNESVSSVTLAAQDAPVMVRDLNVGADYFAALGMTLRRGRDFQREDANPAEAGAIVDEHFVALHLADRDPLGTRIELQRDGGETLQLRIVGIVPQVRHLQLEERPEHGALYRFEPEPALRVGSAVFVLRSDLPLSQLAPQLRQAARTAGLRTVDIAGLDQRMRDTLSHRINLMSLVGAFAVLGVLLAAVGLFALVAFSVQRREAEFGLRLALGAPPASLKWLALREGLRAGAPGLVLGLGGALAVGRLLSARLYQVSPWDPLTLTAVLAGATGLVLLACLGPARRAAALDPLPTLRHE